MVNYGLHDQVALPDERQYDLGRRYTVVVVHHLHSH